MGIKTQTGFTIIETMLFLAITGALAAAILAGSGIAISQQRYRDSVNSFKSYIQQQYSEVTNVVNGRDKSWTCDTNGNVIEVNVSAGQARGTSECVMLGRYITIDGTGTKLTSANVVGYRPATTTRAANDIDELKTYRLTVSPIEQDTSEVSWGAQVVKPETTTPVQLSMLIVRSPLSGAVLTFTAEGAQADLNALLASQNMSQKRDLCINADLGSFVGERLAVRISAFASNQGAIEIPLETESVCD